MLRRFVNRSDSARSQLAGTGGLEFEPCRHVSVGKRGRSPCKIQQDLTHAFEVSSHSRRHVLNSGCQRVGGAEQSDGCPRLRLRPAYRLVCSRRYAGVR
jgi:hypothetical protein